MGIITIQGGTPLRGETVIQGAKNSALPILAASLLSGDVCRIEGHAGPAGPGGAELPRGL